MVGFIFFTEILPKFLIIITNIDETYEVALTCSRRLCCQVEWLLYVASYASAMESAKYVRSSCKRIENIILQGR